MRRLTVLSSSVVIAALMLAMSSLVWADDGDETPPPPPPPLICDDGTTPPTSPPPPTDTRANQKPFIYDMRPLGCTTDTAPTITAIVSDDTTNLKKKAIRLFLDGRRVKNFGYNRRADRLAHDPGELSFGTHEVKVTATESIRREGKKPIIKRAVEVWSFEVGVEE